MANYANKRTYNNIPAKADEELVPVLAYDLVNWKNDCIKNGLGKSETLVDTRNLETWHYGGRKILVGFVAVPKDKVAIAIDTFNKERNIYLEETRKKRCLISDGKGGLIICPPKKMKCNNCKHQGDPNNITARCLSYDKFLEDNSDDNKKRFEPFQESNVEEIVLLKIKLERLIEQFENINKEYANIIRLLYEGYDKAEIIEQLGIDKGKTQAYAGIHRNHHFDTIERLHPLHPVIGLDYSSFYGGLQSSLFFHEKRDITALGKQYFFLLIIIHLSSIKATN
ncbi:hypothetical protein [Catenibacterium mitsuokai]|uniref:hypothetical protein n=1 Tax=Catenibacterium mitsuokai TaxID=100886 RepID=UPI003F9281E7